MGVQRFKSAGSRVGRVAGLQHGKAAARNDRSCVAGTLLPQAAAFVYQLGEPH